MRLNSPRCNGDCNDPNNRRQFFGCSDLLGSNHKLLGGFAGIATGLIFATEFQGEGTPHGHGFVALANLYQHNSLQDIAAMLENARTKNHADLVERVKAFCNHIQRESHIDEEQHLADLEKLEKGFNRSNDERVDPANTYLSVRTRSLFDSRTLCSAWENAPQQSVEEDAEAFKRRYHAHVQLIFSRVQHHWHAKNDKGERIPSVLQKPECQTPHKCLL